MHSKYVGVIFTFLVACVSFLATGCVAVPQPITPAPQQTFLLPAESEEDQALFEADPHADLNPLLSLSAKRRIPVERMDSIRRVHENMLTRELQGKIGRDILDGFQETIVKMDIAPDKAEELADQLRRAVGRLEQ